MSKGLEALHRIANANNHFKYDTLELMDKDFQIVQQELLRLEAIDNANPSEALECLEWLIKNYIGNDYYKYEEELSTIKQALLKAQEQEKVIDIINEKCVGIFQLTCCKNVDEYNDLKFVDYEKLTKKEFGLLKKYIGRIFKEELKDV